jgi:hypothetical protein
MKTGLELKFPEVSEIWIFFNLKGSKPPRKNLRNSPKL